jgi:DNA replication protein DnaC
VENLEAQAKGEPKEENDSISQSNRKCEHCGIFYSTHKYRLFNGDHSYDEPNCQCEKRIWEDQEKQEKIKQRAERWKKSVPSRFQNSSFQNYIPKNQKQKQALEAMTADPLGSFFIVGSYGSGKTHLLYSQMRQYLMDEKYKGDCILKSTADILHEIRQSEMDKGECRALELVRRGQRFHFLWDDADKIKVTDFKIEGLFELIDGIYKNEMPLSITSNLDISELQAKLSPAICRRIDDICRKIVL